MTVLCDQDAPGTPPGEFAGPLEAAVNGDDAKKEYRNFRVYKLNVKSTGAGRDCSLPEWTALQDQKREEIVHLLDIWRAEENAKNTEG